jgi:predicted 2-oxoglutarate/Fe(II)-dependent dioxygenase YbiX
MGSIYDGFLSHLQSSKLIETIDQSTVTPSAVSQGARQRVDFATRRSSSIQMNLEIQDEISGAIAALKPRIEKHFCANLGLLQTPVFLRYQPGDYFRPHCDNSGNPAQPNHIRRREISVVIFLNDARKPDSDDVSNQSFEGGDLILYRLCDKVIRPSWSNYSTLVRPQTGLLIGFTTNLLHEVTPIVNGVRYSIACWFESSVPK